MVLWASPKKMSTFLFSKKNIGRANPQKWHPYIPACFFCQKNNSTHAIHLNLWYIFTLTYICLIFLWFSCREIYTIHGSSLGDMKHRKLGLLFFFSGCFQVSRSTTSGVGFFWWHLALWCNGTFRGTKTAKANGSGSYEFWAPKW